MKIKNSVENLFYKFSGHRIVNTRKLVTSYVSLFLVLTVLVGTTVSWFTFANTSSVDSDTFTLEAASGLRVNDGESISNHITLDNITLDESSSVDGRNMFFPTKGSFTSKTSEMFYREGNVGDKNQKYVYKDFKLKGYSGNTDVFVKSYNITITGDDGTIIEKFTGSTDIIYEEDANGNKIPKAQVVHEECPVRIAFITDSSATPQVIDPTALIDNYVKKYNAVSSTNETGVASTSVSNALSFSDYYYLTGTPIFRLQENEPLNVTMVVWLEGSENSKTGKSNSGRYAGKKISVDVQLESNWAENETVYFVDDTIGANSTPETDYIETPHWITTSADKGESIILMSYTDSIGDIRTVVMKRSKLNINGCAAWYASIPKNVDKNISFYRYDVASETIFNAWHTKDGVNREMTDKGQAWINAYYKRPLDESRNLSDGTHSIVYTALRDNGNGEVSEKDHPNDYMKLRLAPGIGYWNYTRPTGGEEGGGEGGDTPPPEVDSKDKFSVFLNLRVDDTWVQNNLSKDYKLYVELSDKSSYELTKESDNRYITENQYAASGTNFVKFYISNGYERTDLELEDYVPLVPNGETGYGYSFKMQSNNIIKYFK